MNIQPISSNKFVVGLSKTDMVELDITYDDMDYSNIETKRVIWTILDAVRRTIGRDVDPSGNMMIEAAPDVSGGCLLMFTVAPSAQKSKSGTVIQKSDSNHIFEFDSIDNLLDLISVLGKENVSQRIYTDSIKFRAEFSCDIAAKYRHVIEEYGKFIGKDKLHIAVTREHWKLLERTKSST